MTFYVLSSSLLPQHRDAEGVSEYQEAYAKETRRQAERAARHARRRRDHGKEEKPVRSKKVPDAKPAIVESSEEDMYDEIPAAAFVQDASKHEQEEIQKQLTLNRRMSVTLQKTLVQKAIESKQNVGVSSSTSEDSFSESRNESMATGQFLEDDFPRKDSDDIPRKDSLATGHFEEDEMETLTPEVISRQKAADSIGGVLEDEIEIIDQNADLTLDLETKDDIIALVATWGGREAVEAAQAGDVESVQRAIERQSEQELAENLSPRSSRAKRLVLKERLQRLHKRMTLDRRKAVPDQNIGEARQRLAVALSGNDSDRNENQNQAENLNSSDDEDDSMTMTSATFVMPEETAMQTNISLANKKIQEIMTLKLQVGQTEESESSLGVPGTDSVRSNEAEHKTAIINDLLLLLAAEKRSSRY